MRGAKAHHIAAFIYARFARIRAEKHGLHRGAYGAEAPFSMAYQAAGKPVFFKEAHILRRNIGYAEARHVAFAYRYAVGYVCAEHQLAPRIQPAYIGGWIGLRVAKALRIAQRRSVIHTAAAHRVQYIIRCAVHYAAYGYYRVHACRAGKGAEPRYAAARRRSTAQGHAVFARKCGKLIIICAHKLLVGCNNVLFRPKRSAYVFMRGFKPAHDFNYYVRICFVKYLIKIACDHAVKPLKRPARKHGANVQRKRPLRKQLIKSAADSSESQQSNVHISKLLPCGTFTVECAHIRYICFYNGDKYTTVCRKTQ